MLFSWWNEIAFHRGPTAWPVNKDVLCRFGILLVIVALGKRNQIGYIWFNLRSCDVPIHNLKFPLFNLILMLAVGYKGCVFTIVILTFCGMAIFYMIVIPKREEHWSSMNLDTWYMRSRSWVFSWSWNNMSIAFIYIAIKQLTYNSSRQLITLVCIRIQCIT